VALAGHLFDIGPATAADSYSGNIYFVVRRQPLGAMQALARRDIKQCCACGGATQELTAVKS
jgi:hypothetical protein